MLRIIHFYNTYILLRLLTQTLSRMDGTKQQGYPAFVSRLSFERFLGFKHINHIHNFWYGSERSPRMCMVGRSPSAAATSSNFASKAPCETASFQRNCPFASMVINWSSSLGVPEVLWSSGREDRSGCTAQ